MPFVPRYCSDLFHHSLSRSSSLVGLLVSQSCQVHSHLRVLAFRVPLLGVVFPQLFARGAPSLPFSICSHTREAFKEYHPRHHHTSTFNFLTAVNLNDVTSTSSAAVSPALRTVLLVVLKRDVLSKSLPIHFTSAWNQFDYY